MSTDYIPSRGDIVRLDTGTENPLQQDRLKRNMLVVSPKAYNEKTGFALFCPVKNKSKGYPFEVTIPEDSKAKGFILSDQVKSLNWKNRNTEFICRLQEEKLNDVIAKLRTLT
ncbi:MAG: type II toxin-antitoxin system PemK/MazF family toxin [Ignavibacteriae bacterium]|nr:type II toxin-antitoxin system PemK/MazF family toxin [Ignavibacteriota bacterium]